ncbi:putative two-component system sensor kinase [Actinacidiphila reveromycinica]|uniref:Oxygen sensor histidine kinase NreB n=1 Tax=Actinacidiphila reveromycinica TaxID=659352 RepID=A0A7U3VSP1_9ACTN|nr:sensor histidine kinase [Streptomyces sp. SN-593]BBB01969.1 putative two-component system sensor kinase [Streptomyces sp. SN-593]
MTEGGGAAADGGTEGSGAHAWERTFLPWDCYFAVVWAATVLFALAAQSPGLRVRAAAVGLLALLVPWYLAAGRPLMIARTAGGRRSSRYVAVVVVIFLAAAPLVGEVRLGAFAVVPQCFMLLRLRTALVAVAVVNAVPVAGWALLWRPGEHDLYANSVFAVVTLMFSMVVGGWIIRIIEQSTQRAELLAELRASRAEVARLSAERGALAERERLAREIHDTLAQGFTSLLMLVQAVQSDIERDPAQSRRHLDLMARTARENLAEARALVAGSAPADLAAGSLPDALRRIAARHSAQSGASAEVEVTGTVRRLPPAVEVVALRACQEALANVLRHAGVRVPVTIRLAYGDGDLVVTVRDEGCGLDTGEAPASGYGLPGLRARAAELGGRAEATGAPGRGVTVSVTLPAEEVR